MSFSSNVKNELCKIKPYDFWHKIAEAYGLLLFAASFNKDSILFISENKGLISKISDLITDLTGSNVNIKSKCSFRDKRNFLYYLSIPSLSDRENILKIFKFTNQFCSINLKMFHNQSCMNDFLRGTFLSCGNVSDPNTEYKIGFYIQNEILANDLFNILLNIKNLNIKPHIIKIKSNNIIYIKDNEQVSDLLTFIGANNATLEFIQIKMLKEVRNYVNRTTNCQTSNLNKITKAAINQIAAINKIKYKKGLDYLPENLKILAKLRIKHPELSLNELIDLLPTKISKSGINYRLNTIIKISKEI